MTAPLHRLALAVAATLACQGVQAQGAPPPAAVQSRPAPQVQPRDADRRLARAPGDLQALEARARSLDRLGRYDEALPAYQRWAAVLEKAHGPRHEALLWPLARIATLAARAGRNADALAASTRAVQLQRSLHGDADPDTGYLLVNHSILLRRMGRLQEARAPAEEAVRIAEALHGPEHVETAAALHQLVRVLHELGEYRAALPLAERALAAAQKADAQSSLTSLLLMRLAHVRMGLGQEREALPLLQQSLAIAQAVHGPEDQATADRMADLADLHERLGDLRQALELQERALAISARASGAESLATTSVRYSYATLLLARGEPRRALPQLESVLEVQRAELDERHPDIARTLAALAEAHVQLADYGRARPLLHRAVRLLEQALGPRHPSVPPRLAQLAGLEQELGRLASAQRLYERALALAEQASGPEHADTVQRMVDLGRFHHELGRHAQAQVLLSRALQVAEAAWGPGHPLTGEAAGALGSLLESTGDARARELLERSLDIAERAHGAAHPSVADAAARLAEFLQAQGDVGPALALRERVLALQRAAYGDGQPQTADALAELGLVHEALGQFDAAQAALERALALTQQGLGADHPETARRLNELGFLLDARGQWDAARAQYERALAIVQERLGPRHWRAAQLHNNIGYALQRQGRLQEALPWMRRAVALVEGDPALEAQALAYEGNLGRLLGMLGRAGEADAVFQRLWQRHARLPANPMVRYHLLRKQATALAATGRREAAIFFGKQAVNAFQAVRSQARGMERKLQQGLAERHQDTYQQLAGWLVEAGRLAEAEQVLGLLKDLELFELTRQSSGPQAASLDGAEQALDRRFQDLQQGLAQAHELEGLNRLQRQGRRLTPEQQARRTQLQAAQRDWRTAFQRFMAQVQPALSSDAAAAQAARTAAEQAAGRLRTLVRAANEQAAARHVALSFLLTDDAVSVIVTTAEGSFARRTPVPLATLSAEIARMRQLLQEPRLDPRPAAQALYRRLLQPLAQDLATLQPQVLVLNLTGILRYVPFAALHDGEQYLAQRYALAIYTSAGAAPLRAEAATAWRVAGLGLTRPVEVERQRFLPLPAVAGELAGIVRTQDTPEGALPGQIVLDAQFTREAFEETLARAAQGDAPVVHVASHFHLSPASDEGSYLVLGDATPLRLSEIKEMDFQGVQLFTLSACNTASVGGRNENGSEVEGLAAAVQMAGARAVLATLWPVADASTAAFMQRFYQLRTQSAGSHALALQQAQVALITGQLPVAAAAAAERGISAPSRSAAAQAPAFQAPADAPHAHPFYWAPFVLMGNWL